jgi:hypothetical protein
VPRCVNPWHLEPVPQAVNSARATRTHCKRGHLFTPESVYRNRQGGRQCRTCILDARRAKAAAA